jgi:hypothetical protein
MKQHLSCENLGTPFLSEAKTSMERFYVYLFFSLSLNKPKPQVETTGKVVEEEIEKGKGKKREKLHEPDG